MPPERSVLVVSVHPPGRLPSLRFRFEQYVPFLRETGTPVVAKPFDVRELRRAVAQLLGEAV